MSILPGADICFQGMSRLKQGDPDYEHCKFKYAPLESLIDFCISQGQVYQRMAACWEDRRYPRHLYGQYIGVDGLLPGNPLRKVHVMKTSRPFMQTIADYYGIGTRLGKDSEHSFTEPGEPAMWGSLATS